MRLWQERRVLSESVILSYIQDLDSASNPASGDPNCPRLKRNERAFDDPLRKVEGIIDEYGRYDLFSCLFVFFYINKVNIKTMEPICYWCDLSNLGLELNYLAYGLLSLILLLQQFKF